MKKVGEIDNDDLLTADDYNDDKDKSNLKDLLKSQMEKNKNDKIAKIAKARNSRLISVVSDFENEEQGSTRPLLATNRLNSITKLGENIQAYKLMKYEKKHGTLLYNWINCFNDLQNPGQYVFDIIYSGLDKNSLYLKENKNKDSIIEKINAAIINNDISITFDKLLEGAGDDEKQRIISNASSAFINNVKCEKAAENYVLKFKEECLSDEVNYSKKAKFVNSLFNRIRSFFAWSSVGLFISGLIMLFISPPVAIPFFITAGVSFGVGFSHLIGVGTNGKPGSKLLANVNSKSKKKLNGIGIKNNEEFKNILSSISKFEINKLQNFKNEENSLQDEIESEPFIKKSERSTNYDNSLSEAGHQKLKSNCQNAKVMTSKPKSSKKHKDNLSISLNNSSFKSIDKKIINNNQKSCDDFEVKKTMGPLIKKEKIDSKNKKSSGEDKNNSYVKNKKNICKKTVTSKDIDCNSNKISTTKSGKKQILKIKEEAV